MEHPPDPEPGPWLEHNAPGFEVLTEEERISIMEFALLWSLFEAKALHNSASANAICEACKNWTQADLLNSDKFRHFLAYFQDRYIQDDNPNYRFAHLHLRQNDHPDLVRDVLLGAEEGSSAILAALLIIVYRYRNNLFHGVKWAYGLKEQHANFRMANALLMKVMEATNILS